MKSQRVNLIKKNSYSTTRNRFKISKTPRNKLKILYLKKKISPLACKNENIKLNGIKVSGVRKFSHFCRRKKTVSRAYGGNLSGRAVKEKIIKAFLIEEQKLIKKLLKKND